MACPTSRRSAACASVRTRWKLLRADLALELDAVPLLREAIAHCETVSDYVSRKLFADILESEEEHVDWIETQLSLIERIGEPNYLAQQLDKG